MARLTLHVGAGTFAPLEGGAVEDHVMHAERVEVGGGVLRTLVEACEEGRPVCPVGTTSVRTLETLYWLGVKELRAPSPPGVLSLGQWDPYTLADEAEREGRALPRPSEALGELERRRRGGGEEEVISAVTSLLIVPGYR